MNLSDMILIDRSQPPISVGLAMQFGLIAPFEVPHPGKRYCNERDDDEDIVDPPKSITELRIEERRVRREAMVDYLLANGLTGTAALAEVAGVVKSTAYDDLNALQKERRVEFVKRDGKMLWKAK